MDMNNIYHPTHPVFGSFWKKSRSKKWAIADLLDDDDDELLRHATRATTREEFRILMAIKRARTVNTYAYDGNLLDNIEGIGPNPASWWSKLSVHEYERRFSPSFACPRLLSTCCLSLWGLTYLFRTPATPDTVSTMPRGNS